MDKLHIEVLDEEMARVLRAKTAVERLRIASDMFAAARRMIASHLAAEQADRAGDLSADLPWIRLICSAT